MTEPAWRRSRYSGSTGGQCVEVAAGAGPVSLRDSKDPGGAVLSFVAGPWRSFVAAVRAGEFDLTGDRARVTWSVRLLPALAGHVPRRQNVGRRARARGAEDGMQFQGRREPAGRDLAA
jgi:Domain of unknown function (DUF397)